VIKVKIKHPGAHMMAGKELRELKVGEVLELQGDELPNFLIGKAEILGDNEGKSLVTNDELLESAMAENKELSDKLAYATAELQKVPEIVSELASVKAKNEKLTDDLESARELAVEQAKKLDAANAEISELKKPKVGK